METTEGDAFERLSAILTELRRDRAQMAPAFLFVDLVVADVNELVRELKKEGAITADEVPGRRFGAAANPVLRLPKQKT